MITVHASRNDDIEDLMFRLMEARDRITSDSGIPIETVRVTLPDNAGSIDERLAIAKAATGSEGLISVGGIKPSENLNSILEEIASEGLFAYIPLDEPKWDTVIEISKAIHQLADLDPSYATHIGVNVLGTPLVTPYYPLSSSPGHERLVSTALTYPNYLYRMFLNKGIDGLKEGVETAYDTAYKILKVASEMVDAKPVGVDLSVAPWMEETSLGLVEAVAGTRLPNPGIAMGIARVNKIISDVSNGRHVTGFNEVQLPVAEDAKLKARVSEGETSARDLARLSGVCLAGLDLPVVPGDIEAVAGLILEVYGYSVTKGKPLGVRVVPVEGVEPGDKVRLEKFGDTPVMPI
ncbi:MAG: DUF711 family protein [Desulfurococcales archaeon]|nr:DUF711 family protein [Desulfurococcales archaeon]